MWAEDFQIQRTQNSLEFIKFRNKLIKMQECSNSIG